MWIKDIRNYDVEIYKEGELIYSGNVDETPEDIKDNETLSVTMGHKKLVINVA